LLEQAGIRPTAPRLAILTGLSGRRAAVTAQELHHELRGGTRPAGLATVYRTLRALADAGVVDVFQRGAEEAFRLCGAGHHHHLVCEGCGTVEEVDAAEIEQWVARTARHRRFRVTSHHAEINGLCADCSPVKG
jgi:Fur family ferric uptake transcriptional regulator